MEEWVERPKAAFTALGVAPQKSVLPSTITGAGWTLAVSNSRALPSRHDLFKDRVLLEEPFFIEFLSSEYEKVRGMWTIHAFVQYTYLKRN